MVDMPLQTDPVSLPGRPFGRMARSVAGYTLLSALMATVLLPVQPASAYTDTEHLSIGLGEHKTITKPAINGVSVSFQASSQLRPRLGNAMPVPPHVLVRTPPGSHAGRGIRPSFPFRFGTSIG